MVKIYHIKVSIECLCKLFTQDKENYFKVHKGIPEGSVLFHTIQLEKCIHLFFVSKEGHNIKSSDSLLSVPVTDLVFKTMLGDVNQLKVKFETDFKQELYLSMLTTYFNRDNGTEYVASVKRFCKNYIDVCVKKLEKTK